MREIKVQRRRAPPYSLSLAQVLHASDTILELLPVATCICDLDGRIVQYNSRAIEIWGRTPKPGQTHEAFTAQAKFYSPEGERLPESKVSQVLRSGQALRNEEVIVDKADGSRIAVLMNIDPLLDAHGELVGLVTCFQDITDRNRVNEALAKSQQELRQQEQRWNATYEHAAIGIVEIDAEGRFLRVNESICAITGLSREELLGWRLFARTHPDDRDVDEDLYRRQVKGEIGFYSIEKRFVRKDGRVIWCSIRSSTVRDADNNFLYGVRVVQDVTERKEAEDRQKLLIDELNHRVKNTLATVQSLASQTARETDTPEAFRDAFEGRLIALSQAHDQLTRRHWVSADLRAIVSAVTAPYRTPSQDRIEISGDDVTLTPRAALTLALVFHELTTNAVKYGALSTPAGRIETHWRVVRGPSQPPVLWIEWRERDGPAVTAPLRSGFGSRFIQGSVAVELQGTAKLNFEAAGLRCTMEFPIEPGIPPAEPE